MTTTPPLGPTHTPGGFGIDPRLGAAALRAPAASREDSCPQAILKFYRPSSLDYRARHGLPVNLLVILCYKGTFLCGLRYLSVAFKMKIYLGKQSKTKPSEQLPQLKGLSALVLSTLFESFP